MTKNNERELFWAAVNRADKARDAQVCVTCPASRHVQMMAEHIGARKPYPMLAEEPEHCAESMLATVEALYKARERIAELERPRTRERFEAWAQSKGMDTAYWMDGKPEHGYRNLRVADYWEGWKASGEPDTAQETYNWEMPEPSEIRTTNLPPGVVWEKTYGPYTADEVRQLIEKYNLDPQKGGGNE